MYYVAVKPDCDDVELIHVVTVNKIDAYHKNLYHVELTKDANSIGPDNNYNRCDIIFKEPVTTLPGCISVKKLRKDFNLRHYVERFEQDLIMRFIRDNPDATLPHLNVEEQKQYDEVIMELVEKKKKLIRHVKEQSEELQRRCVEGSTDVTLSDLINPPRDVIEKCIKKRPEHLNNVPVEHLDMEMCLLALKNLRKWNEYWRGDTPHIEILFTGLLEEFRTDEILHVCMDKNYYTFPYSNETVSQSVALRLVKNDHTCFKDLRQELRDDPEVALEAVKGHGHNLQFTSLRTRDLCAEAVYPKYSAIMFIPSDAEFYDEFLKCTTTNDPKTLWLAPEEKRTDELYKLALSKDASLWVHVPHMTVEMWRAMKSVDIFVEHAPIEAWTDVIAYNVFFSNATINDIPAQFQTYIMVRESKGIDGEKVNPKLYSEFLASVVIKKQRSLKGIPEQFITEKLCDEYYRQLQYIPAKFRTLARCKRAVECNWKNIQYCSSDTSGTPNIPNMMEICSMVRENIPHDYRGYDNGMKKTLKRTNPGFVSYLYDSRKKKKTE